MSQIAALPRPFVPSGAHGGARSDATQKPKTDAQAVAAAKQALDRAQGRVDADNRAHSPGCVAVDQKGVNKASADLAHAQAAENGAAGDAPDGSAPAAGGILSITA